MNVPAVDTPASYCSYSKIVIPRILIALGVILAVGAALAYYYNDSLKLETYQIALIGGASALSFAASWITWLVALRSESAVQAEIDRQQGPRAVYEPPARVKEPQPFSGPLNPDADVVIVGAGPIGLWTAIQIALRAPHVKIEILDKHGAYQRTHSLKLSADSFKGAPNDARLGTIIEGFSKQKMIPIGDIERQLCAFIDEKLLKITIKRNAEIADPRLLKAHYPKVRIVLGADGAHSMVRKTVFQNAFEVNEVFRHILEVKYKTTGQRVELGISTEQYPTFKAMGTVAQERIGKDKADGSRTHTLRLFIDAANYEKLKNANLAAPLTFQNQDLIPPKILNAIRLWLGVKKDKGEKITLNSEKITVITLGAYRAKEFVKKEEEVLFALVGDAALGVPFEESCNQGLKGGTVLSVNCAALFAGTTGSLQDYATRMGSIATAAIRSARLEDGKISMANLFVKVSALVPWQVNVWDDKTIKRHQAQTL